ncbi:type VI secretion system-associated FHA domain protein TagH, partial [Burkholderia sola]
DPIWVAEQPVRSGQEVSLPLGARLRIGAYTLAAVAPGTPFEAPPPAAIQNAQSAQAAQATQAAAPSAMAVPQPQVAPPPVADHQPLQPEAMPLAAVLPAAAPGSAVPWDG